MFVGLSEAQHCLLLLQYCGDLLPNELPDTRTDLAHMIWDTLQELGTVHGIWHFSVKFQLILKTKYMIMSRDQNAGRSYNMRMIIVPLKGWKSSNIWEQR